MVAEAELEECVELEYPVAASDSKQLNLFDEVYISLSLPNPKTGNRTDRLTVPCGKCAACLTNRRNDWAVRLKVEHQNADSAYFITLTYDEQHQPLMKL